MAKLGRIYRRTAVGARAWAAKDPALSDEHRRILGMIESETHGDVIVSEAAAAAHDLDFTTSFAFAKAA